MDNTKEYQILKEMLTKGDSKFSLELERAVQQGFDVNYSLTRGQTLLSTAVASAGSHNKPYYCDAIRDLLNAGADVNIKDRWGYSVTARAVAQNLPTDIIRIMLDKTNDINELDRNGRSIFGTACRAFVISYNNSEQQNSRLEVIRILLENEADPDIDSSWKILNAGGNEYAQEDARQALKDLGHVLEEAQGTELEYTGLEYSYTPYF